MKKPYYAIDQFEPRRSVGYLIKRCGALMAISADKAFEGGAVNYTQWSVLMRLRVHGTPMSATELSECMPYDLGALSRVIDQLEAAGMVRRERSQRDRRSVEIALTEEGSARAVELLGFAIDLSNKMLERFSRNECDTLVDLLQRLHDRLQEHTHSILGETKP